MAHPKMDEQDVDPDKATENRQTLLTERLASEQDAKPDKATENRQALIIERLRSNLEELKAQPPPPWTAPEDLKEQEEEEDEHEEWPEEGDEEAEQDKGRPEPLEVVEEKRPVIQVHREIPPSPRTEAKKDAENQRCLHDTFMCIWCLMECFAPHHHHHCSGFGC